MESHPKAEELYQKTCPTEQHFSTDPNRFCGECRKGLIVDYDKIYENDFMTGLRVIIMRPWRTSAPLLRMGVLRVSSLSLTSTITFSKARPGIASVNVHHSKSSEKLITTGSRCLSVGYNGHSYLSSWKLNT